MEDKRTYTVKGQRRTPEERLLIAVLHRAWIDAKEASDNLLRSEARDFLMGQDRVVIADILGINPYALPVGIS